MKTIFITGASSGLGKATARLFQSRGWQVVATMRRPEKEQDLTQLSNVTVMELDITDRAQIRRVVGEVAASFEIDVVYNNAGYGLMGPLEGCTEADIDREINTNLLGTIFVTQAFIPFFKQRRSGLFITTSSLGGLISFPFSSLYHATKWAIEGWSESMAHELGLFGIGIKTIAPGGIKTDFAGRCMQLKQHADYQLPLENFMRIMDPDTFSEVASVAEVVYEAATDHKDQIRYVAGEDAARFYARRLELGPDAFRKELSRLLI